MKRFSFCVFALIFWLIAFGTLVSFRVEQWMTPVVSVVKANMSDELPLACLRQDDTGTHLFQIKEESDWSEGVRVEELSPEAYRVEEEKIIVASGRGQEFVQYATKDIQNGSPVMKRQGSVKKLPDQCLVLYEGDAAPQLQSVEEAAQPFMKDYAIKTLGAKQVYSVSELSSFLGVLPPLTLLPGGFLLLLLIWVASLYLVKDPRKNRKALGLNFLMAILLLAALPLLLYYIELPPSLLPPDTITDFGYYIGEFSEIFSALHTLSEGGDIRAEKIYSQATSSLWICFAILLSGVILGVVIMLAEIVPHKAQKRAAPKHLKR